MPTHSTLAWGSATVTLAVVQASQGAGEGRGGQGGMSWSQAAASRAHHLGVYSALMGEVSLRPHGTFLPGTQMITVEIGHLD